ncbi:MAG: DUF177 domain-containing protein [Pseudomonadota bacterium]|nr:DUF177 domain-containing protein [Pseudomonadota bacterium]QKK05611.1 MAG: DUF177 domain-containing protein [Pseudomonadota bacterium]
MLSEIIRLADIDTKEKTFVIKATEGDCKELAARLHILEIADVQAKLTLKRVRKHMIELSGKLSCEAVQECVVTLEPVKTVIDTEFDITFSEEEQELAEDTLMPDLALEPVEGDVIDLGEIVAQQISIALPDYPRAEGVAFEGHIEAPEALLPPEQRTSRPFATLLKVAQQQQNNQNDKDGE